VTSETSRNQRTLAAYVTTLLEYPRWIIERDVDFTHCRLGGHYNEFLSECVDCKFGPGCRWLDRQRTQKIEHASLQQLVRALECAVRYFQPPNQPSRITDPQGRGWIREARRFLHHESAERL